jgi:hypothetical protein
MHSKSTTEDKTLPSKKQLIWATAGRGKGHLPLESQKIMKYRVSIKSPPFARPVCPLEKFLRAPMATDFYMWLIFSVAVVH